MRRYRYKKRVRSKFHQTMHYMEPLVGSTVAQLCRTTIAFACIPRKPMLYNHLPPSNLVLQVTKETRRWKLSLSLSFIVNYWRRLEHVLLNQ
jgi:hypothetical protein